MIEILKPWLRAVKYSWLKGLAEYQARQAKSGEQMQSSSPRLAFLIGCGRSGTTILGNVLSRHKDVYYFFEPYHLWAAIEPLTDVLNLYHQIDAQLLMGQIHSNEDSLILFNRLFLEKKSQNKSICFLEKTPLNSMRIGYLNALAPRARFIHIVRDGVDVSCSIGRIASTNSYKIVGKPQLNQWWGVENYKWKALSRDGTAAGYYPDEVDLLKDHRSKGAYEWLVSLGEVDVWREQLGNRLYEITYNELTANPEATLASICKFIELETPNHWLHEASNTIHLGSHNFAETLNLPPAMCNTFNYYQERYGFTNRATAVINNL